jgi:hypothetical protein
MYPYVSRSKYASCRMVVIIVVPVAVSSYTLVESSCEPRRCIKPLLFITFVYYGHVALFRSAMDSTFSFLRSLELKKTLFWPTVILIIPLDWYYVSMEFAILFYWIISIVVNIVRLDSQIYSFCHPGDDSKELG